MQLVNHISFSSSEGGAAIAARRLHAALTASGVQSRMTVGSGAAGPDIDLFTPRKTVTRIAQREVARHIRKKYQSQIAGLTSLGMVRSGLGHHLNAEPRQVLNLHWVNSDLISIREIGTLRHPVVWTMHDMWPFSGAEHYTENFGWKDGYAEGQNPGFDLNRWVWTRKRRHWKRPFHLVSPSNWLADCARSSALVQDWPVHVIPNAIDTDVWQPMSRKQARASLGLPLDEPIIGFGAMGGDSDPRKGFAHLRAALSILRDRGSKTRVLIFGAEEHDADLPVPAHFTGRHSDPEDLRAIYACADVFALPSRQDNLPNTGVEALSCGIPVVGFNIGGLPDLVATQSCGRLAKPFDETELADCLELTLKHQLEHRDQSASPMGAAARRHAETTYSMPVVAHQYKELYGAVWKARA